MPKSLHKWSSDWRFLTVCCLTQQRAWTEITHSWHVQGFCGNPPSGSLSLETEGWLAGTIDTTSHRSQKSGTIFTENHGSFGLSLVLRSFLLTLLLPYESLISSCGCPASAAEEEDARTQVITGCLGQSFEKCKCWFESPRTEEGLGLMSPTSRESALTTMVLCKR